MDPRDQLFGEIAVRMRLITPAQLAQCAAKLGFGTRGLGEMAVELGLMSAEQAEEVRRHTLRILKQRSAGQTGTRPAESTAKPPRSSPRGGRPPPVPSTRRAGAPAPPPTAEPARLELDLGTPSPMAPAAPVPAEPARLELDLGTPSPTAPAAPVSAEPAPAAAGAAPQGEPEGLELDLAAVPEAPAPATPLPDPPLEPADDPPAPPTDTKPAAARPANASPALSASPATGGSRAEIAARAVDDPAVRQQAGRAPFLLRALRFAQQNGASDLHVHAGAPLMARAHGQLLPFQGSKALSAATTETALAQVMTDEQWELLARDGDLDFALKVEGLGRFRANAYRQHRGTDAVFRILPPHPPTLEQLGLPPSLKELVNFRTGLVLCTGPVGCGKSTTLAALLNQVIATRRDHVITIENPVEVLFPRGSSVVNQREVGTHTQTFARALRAALREDPDVIAITELRDREAIGLALSAAETGHLVLGTLHTNDAIQTIGRVINAFGADEQAQVRVMLAESLRAVLSQRLVPRADGQGRVVALEVLVVSHAVSNLIREEKELQLGSLMQTGKAQGMLTLDDSLSQLLNQGLIEKDQAQRFASNKERFR